MEIIIGILQTIGWIVIIASTIFSVIFVRLFLKNLKIQQELSAIEDEVRQTMMVYVEKVKGQLHMYDSISNFFIAQGTTEDELWENAKIRCPDMNILLGNVTVGNNNITVSTAKMRKQ